MLGVAADLGIHKIDLYNYLTGDVITQASAFLATLDKKTPGGTPIQVDDNAMFILRTAGGAGKYIYYRGDHHLTSLGAYYVYRQLAAPLGFSAAEAADFAVSVVCADFAGSDARRLLTAADDRIALFRARGDSALTVTTDGAVRRGLYDFDACGGDDPYGVFPGYGAGYTTIRHAAAHPRILVLCDSYGCALAPFLARHFDVDLVDLRYAAPDVRGLLREENYTAVLCYYGMDTLAAHEILYKLQG
mgnify:CR=1 FL=1